MQPACNAKVRQQLNIHTNCATGQAEAETEADADADAGAWAGTVAEAVRHLVNKLLATNVTLSWQLSIWPRAQTKVKHKTRNLLVHWQLAKRTEPRLHFK